MTVIPLEPRTEADPHLCNEQALWTRLRASGDLRAREELVERHLGLARKLARRYARSPDALDDLVQVAALGLVKAVDRYEPARGYAFATFATPTILGELRRHFRDTRWAVHVPRELQERVQSVTRAQHELTTELGHSPTPNEVAQAVGLSVADVLEAREAARAIESASLDAPVSDPAEGVDVFRETVGMEDPGYELVVDRDSIEPALALLTQRERYTLAMRFDREMTQSEIGARLGISQMQVSRILRDALRRLRTAASPDARAAA
jgi:RNA polymerase sigma-B factor